MPNFNFSPFPLLQTERLQLRKLEAEDAPEIFLLRSDDEVNKYLDRCKAHTLADAKNFIARVNEGIGNNESLYWGIVPKAGKKLVGTVCLWNLEPARHKAELGYELMPGEQGKGVMQEVLAKVLDFGFSTLQLRIIEAYLRTDNIRSVHVLDKFNFQRDPEAETRFSPAEKAMNMVIYSLRQFEGKRNDPKQPVNIAHSVTG